VAETSDADSHSNNGKNEVASDGGSAAYQGERREASYA